MKSRSLSSRAVRRAPRLPTVITLVSVVGAPSLSAQRPETSVPGAGAIQSGTAPTLAGDVAVIGAPGSTIDTAGGLGRSSRRGGSARGSWFSHWSDDTNTRLGQSVAVDGDRAAMGAPAKDQGLDVEAGRCTAIQREPRGHWALEVGFLLGSAPAPGAPFGVWYQSWFPDPAGPNGFSASIGMGSDVPPNGIPIGAGTLRRPPSSPGARP